MTLLLKVPHPFRTQLREAHGALLSTTDDLNLSALPIDEVRPLAEQPVLLKVRAVDKMRQCTVQDVRQRGGSLHVAQQAVPVARVLATDTRVGEPEGRVAGLNGVRGGAAFVFNPE